MGKSANTASSHRGGGCTVGPCSHLNSPGLHTQALAPDNSAPATWLLALPPDLQDRSPTLSLTHSLLKQTDHPQLRQQRHLGQEQRSAGFYHISTRLLTAAAPEKLPLRDTGCCAWPDLGPSTQGQREHIRTANLNGVL